MPQKWFGLSNSEAEEQIYNRRSFQDFLGLTSNDDIPDETTICRFRKVLFEKKFEQVCFKKVKKQLEKNSVAITRGKIVDANI